MKTNSFSLRFATAIVAAAVVGMGLAGCGRDTRVDSDPGPGGPSPADTGQPVIRAEEQGKGSASGDATTAPMTGTDSTGRPGGASGGTTGAGSGSGTSGTQIGPAPEQQNPDRKQK